MLVQSPQERRASALFRAVHTVLSRDGRSGGPGLFGAAVSLVAGGWEPTPRSRPLSVGAGTAGFAFSLAYRKSSGSPPPWFGDPHHTLV